MVWAGSWTSCTGLVALSSRAGGQNPAQAARETACSPALNPRGMVTTTSARRSDSASRAADACSSPRTSR